MESVGTMYEIVLLEQRGSGKDEAQSLYNAKALPRGELCCSILIRLFLLHSLCALFCIILIFVFKYPALLLTCEVIFVTTLSEKLSAATLKAYIFNYPQFWESTVVKETHVWQKVSPYCRVSKFQLQLLGLILKDHVTATVFWNQLPLHTPPQRPRFFSLW